MTRGKNARRHHTHVRENKAIVARENVANVANVDVVDLTGGDDASAGPSVPQHERNAYEALMPGRYKAGPVNTTNIEGDGGAGFALDFAPYTPDGAGVVDLTGGDDASVDASSGPSVPQRKRNALALLMGGRYNARPVKRVYVEHYVVGT